MRRRQKTKSSFPHVLREAGGFTVLELIIVIIFLSLIGASGAFILRNQLLGNLESDAALISSRLAGAQARAIAGVSAVSWGIHFDNTTTSAPSYSLFSGTSYSSPVNTFYLSTQTAYCVPQSGAAQDVIFSKLSGVPTSTQSIIIELRSDAANADMRRIRAFSDGRIMVDAVVGSSTDCSILQ